MTIKKINKSHIEIPAIELLHTVIASNNKMALYPLCREIHYQKVFNLKIINITEKIMMMS